MKKTINIILLIIALCSFGYGLYIDFHPDWLMGFYAKMIIYALPMLLLFVNMLIQVKITEDENEKKKIAKFNMWIIFVLYLVSITSLFFLGSTFRFSGGMRSNIDWKYAHNMINIIPFKTIKNYIFGTHNTSIVVTNIVGNLIILMPLGVFIPYLLGDRINKTWKFINLVILLVVIIEALQFLLNVGAADIDDVILNTLGAIIIYWAYQKWIVSKLRDKGKKDA